LSDPPACSGERWRIEEEVFALAYSGLHWSRDDILDMPTAVRRWYVARLKEQKKAENKEIDEAKKIRRG
jgi:hypothetical protein